MSSGLLCAFTEPFGKVIEKLSETGFLFSQNPSFPSWWNSNPVWAPVLTGWSAGPAADPLYRDEQIGDRCVGTLVSPADSGNAGA
jgi:hypothetical protein